MRVCVSVCACCVCVPHVYRGGVCVMKVYNVCVHLDDQMGTQCIYMYKEPILWSTMCKCTED